MDELGLKISLILEGFQEDLSRSNADFVRRIQFELNQKIEIMQKKYSLLSSKQDELALRISELEKPAATSEQATIRPKNFQLQRSISAHNIKRS